MNKSHIEHLVAALIAQALIWLATGSLWLGFAFVFGLFLGREHAQREYKIGDPSKLKGYEALDFWRWSTDAKLDFLVPVAGALALATTITFTS